jgi:hypothetical protein
MQRLLFISLCLYCSLCWCQENPDTTEFQRAFELFPVSVNSAGSEISPFFRNGSLYFASDRKSANPIVFESADPRTHLFDLYSAKKVDEKTFEHPLPMTKFNSIGNEASVFIDAGDSIILVSANRQDISFVAGTSAHRKEMAILQSTKQGKKWSSLRKLPVAGNTASSYCHASLAEKNTLLLFSSDMPGGYGGMDIYFSRWENGKWSAPENAGQRINSSVNDLYPFLTDKGMLYFSSNRSGGPGGLDVYSVVLSDSAALPKALAAPVNTESDDFGLWMDNSNSFGYMSSDRSGNDEIFYLKSSIPLFVKQAPVKSKFCYTFFEEATFQTLDTVSMKYEWDLAGQKYCGLEVKHCFSKPGQYPIRLNIVDASSGEIFSNELAYDFTVKEQSQLHFTCRDTISPGELLFLDARSSLLEGYSIDKFYWIFSDNEFNEGPFVAHRYPKKGAYRIRLGAVATDSLGKQETFFTDKVIYVEEKRLSGVFSYPYPDFKEYCIGKPFNKFFKRRRS